MFKRSTPFVLAVIFLSLISLQAHAEVKVVEQKFDSEPHRVVQDTTLKVLKALDGGLDPVKEPEKFVGQLSAILDPIVAFDYIAKGVMGNYAKQVSKEQVKQFASAFKLGLVNTYGKGMANFSDLEVAVLAPAKPLGEQRRIAVVQEIRGASGTNQVSYSMAQNRQGQWKMINVVLNGINLGQTFRGQFAAAVQKNKGDVTKTINEWGKS
ncbi:MAG: MlaC/ttg2D family ABC transporter substrate-binding protein [Cellvibrionaceae bacterium]